MKWVKYVSGIVTVLFLGAFTIPTVYEVVNTEPEIKLAAPSHVEESLTEREDSAWHRGYGVCRDIYLPSAPKPSKPPADGEFSYEKPEKKKGRSRDITPPHRPYPSAGGPTKSPPLWEKFKWYCFYNYEILGKTFEFTANMFGAISPIFTGTVWIITWRWSRKKEGEEAVQGG